MRVMNKLIGIDPGHGGSDRANRGPTGYVEADGVLDMALACRDELIEKGSAVVMTRENDKTLSLSERASIFNKAEVDVAVSIHTNAAAASSIRGIETIYSICGGSGKQMAEVLSRRLKNDLGLTIRRVFSRESEEHPGTDYYGIIRKTVMPCVIIEVEFHSNPEAESLLKNSDFRHRAGVSIAHGIMNFIEKRGETGEN